MLSVSQIINIAKDKSIKNYKTNFYITIIKIIKEYCESNQVILEFQEDVNFKITIYSSRPFKDGNSLCNLLYSNGFKYIILHTKITNTELMISINNQKLIYFKLLFIPNTIIYQKLKITYEKNKISLPPLILNLLLECNNKCDIDNLISNENIKIDLFDNYLNQNKIKNYDESIRDDTLKYDIIKDLLQFVKTLSIILLDYYAIHNNPINFNKTLQIICDDFVIIEIKNKIKEILDMSSIKGDIHIQKDHTYIVDDFRLNKTLIYISVYNKKYKSVNKINIINCFNELSYNIIPVSISNNLIAHPYILLRYLIINIIYVYIYLDNSNIIFTDTIYNIQLLLKKIKNIDIKNYKFIGIYKNEELDLEILHVYRPEQYKLKYDKLRII